MYTPRSLRARCSGARRTLPAALAIAFSVAGSALGAQAPADPAVREAMVRGETLLAAGQYQFALREFEALHRANPLEPAPLLGVGRAQEGLGRGRAAERTYHDYIAQRPTDAVGYANLGHVLAASGRTDDALQAYRNAQRLDPHSAAAAQGAGLALLALDRKQEALRSLRDASRLDADDATTWGALATLSLDLDRGIDAASYWEEAMRRDPGYFDRRPDERRRWEKLMTVVGPQLAAAPIQRAAEPAAPPRLAALGDSIAAETSGPHHPSPGRIEEASVSSFGRGSTSSGSGFIVSRERGFVLTNKHVVRGCAAVKVRMAGGESRVAVVRALDQDDDLALLETRLPQGPAVSFRDDPAVRPGDDVVAVGYPLNGLLADQVNVSTGTVNALAGLYNDLHVLQMSAPVQPGSSGGALFDASGNVVGVVVTKLNAKLVADETGDIPQNVNFAVKAAVARDFLKSQRVSVRTAPSSVRRSNADVGEIGRQVTVLVECWK
ncbi:MAG TPA: trypsin-like peptidase domain-containing protein [Gemmatimonadaceae bacterium]|nr:trypsin-like peptidase domain-containing protein [Gemmatimonadaceae bacterium]